MEGNIETVKVSDISEYSWELGERCELLHKYGLSPYRNTEEEIIDLLVKTESSPDDLAFCKECSYCSLFYDSMKNGKTPYNDEDPIRLMEYGGKYWAYEGKHRTCLAKRAKIETIDAYVEHLDYDKMHLLDDVVSPGKYSFTAFFGQRRAWGELAVLWVIHPRGGNYSMFGNAPFLLNGSLAKNYENDNVIPGVAIRTEVSYMNRFFCQIKKVSTTVIISADHHNTKVWLYSIPNTLKMKKHVPRTYYRKGIWRKQDELQMLGLQWPYEIID